MRCCSGVTSIGSDPCCRPPRSTFHGNHGCWGRSWSHTIGSNHTTCAEVAKRDIVAVLGTLQQMTERLLSRIYLPLQLRSTASCHVMSLSQHDQCMRRAHRCLNPHVRARRACCDHGSGALFRSQPDKVTAQARKGYRLPVSVAIPRVLVHLFPVDTAFWGGRRSPRVVGPVVVLPELGR